MWHFIPETDRFYASLAINENPVDWDDSDICFHKDAKPTDAQGRVLADALTVHEQTGLTPAQLQARVAELEGALRELLNSTSMEELGEHTGLMDLLVTGDDVRAGFKALGVE